MMIHIEVKLVKVLSYDIFINPAVVLFPLGLYSD